MATYQFIKVPPPNHYCDRCYQKLFDEDVSAYSSYNHDLKPFIKTLEISPKAVQIVEVNRVPIEQLKLAGCWRQVFDYSEIFWLTGWSFAISSIVED